MQAKPKGRVPVLSLSNEPQQKNSRKQAATARDPNLLNNNRSSVKLGTPILSARPKRAKQPTAEMPKHRFVKRTFSRPTWCQFSNKFITGLNKSGYECRDCGLPVSRRCIAEAKKTTCGEDKDGLFDISTGTYTKNKVFTIYLPHGAKKSVLLNNPNEPLRTVLEKVCRERGINMDEFVPEDTNGAKCDLDTPLGQIIGDSITFTEREDTIGSISDASGGGMTSPLDKKNNKGVLEAFKKRTKSSPQLDKPDIRSNSNPQERVQNSSQLANSCSEKSEKSEKSGIPKKNIIDMYEFGPELGSGAFSVVKAVTHKETKELYAIKILDKYEDDDEQTQKFKQEIAIISSLHHENIVQFYELDEDANNFYVVMELVGGGELFDYIINNGALVQEEAVCVVAQVLKAIEYMHSIGTAHRDLKPENLLFKNSDHKIIKIADFGESKSFKEGTLTTYCGTPDYMAPEVIRGEPYGPEVDIWAIGVITYVMLAGFPPFDGENDVEVFASILSTRYDFPSPEWDNISDDAKNFIRSILIDNPRERMNASQCLQHPWIVNNVPAELRTNTKKPQGVTKLDKTESRESPGGIRRKKSEIYEIPELDMSKNPKKIILDLAEDTFQWIGDNTSTYVGEVKTMVIVLEATTGKKSITDLEKIIYQTYFKRLKEIRTTIKQVKKKK